MELRNIGIYRIKNKINGKVYIGSSINLRKRKREHFNCLRLGIHHSRHLQRSFDKYKEENFDFEVVEYIENKDVLLKTEQEYIDKLRPYRRDKGYNMSRKASGVCLIGEDNPRYGIGLKGDKHPMFGRKHTEESKRLMSISSKGKNAGEKSVWYGKCHSDESKQKIKEARARQIFTDEAKEKQIEARKKPIVMMDKSLNFIKIFGSAKEAGGELGIDPPGITKCLKGKIKTAGGYKWMYETEYNGLKDAQ